MLNIFNKMRIGILLSLVLLSILLAIYIGLLDAKIVSPVSLVINLIAPSLIGSAIFFIMQKNLKKTFWFFILFFTFAYFIPYFFLFSKGYKGYLTFYHVIANKMNKIDYATGIFSAISIVFAIFIHKFLPYLKNRLLNIKNPLTKAQSSMVFLFIYLSLIIFFFLGWFKYFFIVPLKILVEHIMMPLEGVYLDKSLFISFAAEVVIRSLIFSIIAYFTLCVFAKKLVIISVSSFLFLFSVFYLGYNSGIYEIWNKVAEPPSNFYEANYKNPLNEKFIFPEKKRNLIIIQVESLENGFLLPDYENLMPGLNSLLKQNLLCHSGKICTIEQMNGTGYTKAAIVAYTTGLPYFILTGDRNSADFAKHIALGDILSEAGYKNYVLFCSDKTLSNIGRLFETHGNFEVFDYYYFRENNYLPHKNYKFNWGFEDSLLYKFAKLKLNDITKKDTPFLFYLQTMDTHMPLFLTEGKPIKYGSKLKTVLEEMSVELYDFVFWLKEQEWFENTSLVIFGDHTYMESIREITEAHRAPLYTFLNLPLAEELDFREKKISHFDIFPTLLHSIGVSWSSSALGLGVSLMSNDSTLLEKFGKDSLSKALTQNSILYNSFFQP
ncbi:MAG: LTA synthase family protein [Fibromonadales bacterium]|nr:LTA synthase family protein [Fibromonadales bacterium]